MPWRDWRFIVYLLALVAATLVHFWRIEQELGNRTVEMVLDLGAANDYARASGRSLEDVVREYNSSGVTSLVLAEQRWEDLESHGVAALFTGLQLSMFWPDVERSQHLDHSKSYVVVFQAEQAEAVERSLVLALGRKAVARWSAEKTPPGKIVLEVDHPSKSLLTLGMGFSARQAELWSAKGFRLWVRPENKPIADEATVKAELEEVTRLPAVAGVIFGGAANEALGYPEALDTTIDILRQKSLLLGFIELPKAAQQKGIESLVRDYSEGTVRVFAVPPLQQAPLRPERLAQMYGLAARERNARVLYIRPYLYDPSPEKGFQNPNRDFMTLLHNDLQQHTNVGAASRFSRPVALPPVLALLIASGAMAVTWMLVELFVPVPRWAALAGFIGIPLITAVTCVVGPGQQWRTLLAFGSAGAISLYAVAHLFEELERVSQRPTLSGVWWGSSAIWVRMSVWSLTGALLASSLLQETTFKLGLDTFRGVKALTVGIPCLAVLAWFGRGNLKAIVEIFGTPIRLYHLIGFGALAVVAVFYAIRTGNVGGEVGGDALEYEKWVRMFLDQTLGIRPRFKEFLVAHPAMLLTPFALRWGGKNVAWVFLLAGATGQVGLPDTFAHIHTPLLVSLVRCVLGAALGWLLTGLVIYPTLLWVHSHWPTGGAPAKEV